MSSLVMGGETSVFPKPSSARVKHTWPRHCFHPNHAPLLTWRKVSIWKSPLRGQSTIMLMACHLSASRPSRRSMSWAPFRMPLNDVREAEWVNPLDEAGRGWSRCSSRHASWNSDSGLDPYSSSAAAGHCSLQQRPGLITRASSSARDALTGSVRRARTMRLNPEMGHSGATWGSDCDTKWGK